jgi:hypothetical protein
MKSPLAIGRQVHGKPGLLETIGYKRSDLAIIFYD